MTRHGVVSVVLLMLMVAALGTGCSSKVTKENYHKIKTGMTLAEVEDILGEGTKPGADLGIEALEVTGDVYVWQDGNKSISVTFEDGKVIGTGESNL